MYEKNAWIYNEILCCSDITEDAIDELNLKIREELTTYKLENIRSLIPNEWTRNNEDYIEDMFHILSIRLTKLDDIANLIKGKWRICHEKNS